MNDKQTMRQDHDNLVQVMRDFRGKVLKADDIKKKLFKAFPQCTKPLRGCGQASDHCDTTPKEACGCAGTKDAVFVRDKHGWYRVL